MDWVQRVQKTTLHIQGAKEPGVREEKLKMLPILRAGTQAEFEQQQIWIRSSRVLCRICQDWWFHVDCVLRVGHV